MKAVQEAEERREANLDALKEHAYQLFDLAGETLKMANKSAKPRDTVECKLTHGVKLYAPEVRELMKEYEQRTKSKEQNPERT
mmetsp:Transcript_2453/g.5105  ORF Transcript_2453/g.5105 Transcript_2453/m.5105 type:complete len:83 (-) Transcript_2453:555-803(-)|eukprot:CAMPEP_0113870660 /NCGR_PEP_ID=MMETSP0780_2-20120614/2210_1 /TAXON_ID=652834 /ORGANISM="Palpitomonas bilix" /LENGTH=82 /DNA_ID=CAMNT_0000855963 /DNA_START=170 /DNA_END=418 /DNA_ORIENTATION=+ /assembly_acc=CAM_ASM_000599